MVNMIRSGFILLLLLSGCGWDGTPTRENDFVPLTALEISADYSTIAPQTSTKLKVMGDFSGLITKDITDQVVWSSDTPTVADFDPLKSPFRVFGLAPGTAILTATVRGVTNTFTLTVSSATLATMTITADKLSVTKGLATQFTANGIFSDSTTQDLTFDAAWTSSDPAVASISDAFGSKGYTRALTTGIVTISAAFGGLSDSKLLNVTEPVLESIALSLENPSILTLTTSKFTATGKYTDGSTSDITSLVTWDSSNTAIATISNDGTAKALMQGTTTIRATLGNISKITTLKATGGNLTGITVVPATITLVKGTTGRITATGTFTNGSMRDITGVVTWEVAIPSRATVAAPVGNLVWLKAEEVTPATNITATYGSLTPATVTLTVIAPLQLQSMTLSATSLELKAGTSSPLTVEATYSDNTRQNVTINSDWKSDNEAIATVGTSGLDAGRVTGVADGIATRAINATYTYNGTTVSVPVPTRATVTVKAPTLLSLTISPVTSTVAPGYTASFTAMASYGDGTQVNVTNDAKWAWVVDAPSIAILSDSVNQPGQVVGVDIGSAKLTASFGGKTPTQNATVTVTAP